MAELRSVEAAVVALEEDLATLRRQHEQGECVDEAAVDALRTALQKVGSAVDGELFALMDKFRERAKTVDPITNEPRFGPKTMARVVDMLRRYDIFHAELTVGELVPDLRSRIEAFEVKKAADTLQAEELLRQQVLQEETQRIEQDARRREEEEENERQRQRMEEADKQRVAELARLAQLKREERERQRREDEARAQAELERLAHQNASVQVGMEGLSQAVEQLRRGFEGDIDAFGRARQKLLVLLSNVCSSPENAAFRHIPKDNAYFHQDIGQFDGGHDCLLAMGFKELETEPGKRVFIMEEPNLSEDFDKWSHWFDGLKEMKEWLEANAKPSK